MVRSGQRLFWVMPSLSGVRRTRTIAVTGGWRKIPSTAASFHFPEGWSASAALIGKSDTTATGTAAQVHAQNKSNQQRRKKYSAYGGDVDWSKTKGIRTKRHSSRVAFCVPVLVTGLPANHGRWFYPAPIADSPGRYSLFSGPHLADALAGRLLFCGLAGIFQQPVHHWQSSRCNRRAVHFLIYFQLVMGKHRSH